MKRFGLLLMLAACGGGGGFPVDAGADAAPPGGKFTVTWMVTDANNQPIACNQVGGQVIAITLRNRAIAGGFSEAFTCNSVTGTSSDLPPGTYDATFELSGLSGMLAAGTPALGFEITSGATTTLSPLTFSVDATGGMELVFNTNTAGGNCVPVAQMGAGITATTITLQHTGGACEPVTLQISAGATRPAGSYTVDCANPAVAGCIENDQKLTVATMPSGNYKIKIRGRIGATDCWTNDDSLVVPPLLKILKTTLNLAKSTAPGC